MSLEAEAKEASVSYQQATGNRRFLDMNDIVTRLRAEIAWEPEVGDLLSQAADYIDSLRREVRTQRLEIAGLREERRAMLEADRPAVDDVR